MQIRGWPFDGVFLESWPGFCPHGRVEGHARADRAKLCGILCKLWDICVLGEKWVSSVGKSRGRVIRTSVAKREGREGEKIAFVWSDPRARARAASTGFRWSRGCVGMKRVDGNCVLSSTSGYAECLLRLRRVIG